MNTKILVEVSARHCHLSKEDLEALFGAGHELRKAKQLTQPSDYSAEETLSIKIGDRVLSNVRIVGPLREKTQVEISSTDAFLLGVLPPLRISGDLSGSMAVTLVGPAGKIDLREGLMIAKRHLHCSTTEAKRIGLKDGSSISVLIEGERKTTFHNVVVRTREDYKLCLHLDTDEGNAAGTTKIGEGYIQK